MIARAWRVFAAAWATLFLGNGATKVDGIGSGANVASVTGSGIASASPTTGAVVVTVAAPSLVNHGTGADLSSCTTSQLVEGGSSALSCITISGDCVYTAGGGVSGFTTQTADQAYTNGVPNTGHSFSGLAVGTYTARFYIADTGLYTAETTFTVTAAVAGGTTGV